MIDFNNLEYYVADYGESLRVQQSDYFKRGKKMMRKCIMMLTVAVSVFLSAQCGVNTEPQLEGFNFELKPGDFWKYTWTTTYENDLQQPENGTYWVVIGEAESSGDRTYYPLIITGSQLSDVPVKWKYLRISDNRLYVSNDMITEYCMLDGYTASANVGFWADFKSGNTTYMEPSFTYNILSGSPSGLEVSYVYADAPQRVYTLKETYYSNIGPVSFSSTHTIYMVSSTYKFYSISLAKSSFKGDAYDGPAY